MGLAFQLQSNHHDEAQAISLPQSAAVQIDHCQYNGFALSLSRFSVQDTSVLAPPIQCRAHFVLAVTTICASPVQHTSTCNDEFYHVKYKASMIWYSSAFRAASERLSILTISKALRQISRLLHNHYYMMTFESAWNVKFAGRGWTLPSSL